MAVRVSLSVIPLLALQCGCASWMVRAGAYDQTADIYPATVVDTLVLFESVTLPFQSDRDPNDALVYVFAPGAIVDLPIAVVVDTVCLPLDLRKAAEKQAADSDNGEDPARAAVPSMPDE